MECAGPAARAGCAAPTANQEALQQLVSMYFPQYGELQYRKIAVGGADADPDPDLNLELELELDAERPQKEKGYRCAVNVFGLVVEGRDVHREWHDAKEAAALLAHTLLTDFLRLVRGRHDDALFGKLFRPLVEEMQRLCPPPAASGESAGLAPHTLLSHLERDAAQQATRTLAGPLLFPLLASLDAAPRDPAPPSAPPQPQPPAPISAKPSQQNPVSFLYEHWQRRSSTTAEPAFEFFAQRTFFGAIGRYDGREAVVRAVYKRKSDARSEAARLLCHQLFADLVSFSPIPPDAPDLEEHGALLLAAPPAAAAATASANSSVPNVRAEDLPAAPLGKACPKNRKYVSLINEYCQITRTALPDYRTLTLNQSLSTAYCCCVDSYDGRPFASYAFVKKADAKDDCAGRIFWHLVARGAFTDQGDIVPAAKPPVPSRSGSGSRHDPPRPSARDPRTPSHPAKRPGASEPAGGRRVRRA